MTTEKQTLRLREGKRITFAHMEMMGIVNVTPDSFYASSRMMEAGAPAGAADARQDAPKAGQVQPETTGAPMTAEADLLAEAHARAIARAEKHIAEGARMIDVGGESTRPGSAPVAAEEEIRRICPVIREIRRLHPGLMISADTYRAQTARAAIEAGADMINDISGLSFEPELAGVVAEAGAAIVLMHTGGRPKTMQQDPQYEDVVQEVYTFLAHQIGFAVKEGIGRDQIMIDMGIGFGKTADHNMELLRNIGAFDFLGCPHLLAVSRKSVIGQVLQREDPADRLAGTCAITAYAASRGIAAARVHDVKENLDAARMMEALKVRR